MAKAKVKCKRFNYKRNFGIEIELSNNLDLQALNDIVQQASPERPIYKNSSWANTGPDNHYWHIKRDSTCGPKGKTTVLSDYGYEIASYVGKGIKDAKQMATVVDLLKTNGAKINKHCGIHIHASSMDLNRTQVATILANWVKIENTMFQSCPAHRRRNKYCSSISKKISVKKGLTLSNFWEQVKPKQLSVHGNSDKKVTINTVGFVAFNEGRSGAKNTIELRMPEASLEKDDIINWIRIYVHFIENAKKLKMPENLRVVGVADTLEILGLHSHDNLYTLSTGLQKTRNWFLHRIVENSSSSLRIREAKKMLSLKSKE